ncbi:MATE family efflux transporter [Paenibacillus arenilitoris]|uniref:MATE family efflux transporter n=1 Tax=Paenibacillus arenilitoris TaxID=2772299 RepID=A0A927CJE1_9BACL|nr:MATE family efflux transporter [Paenibacillus arenilitoris]MBD2869188.1 MATE family efflux transporter [Paenibacillus arenilitoris]
MASGSRTAASLSLFALTWPIFVESALQMFLRVSDTFMLSKVSDEAVAAVGVANQIIMFAVLLFNVIAVGSAVVITQYLGARRNREISSLASASVAINFLFGVLLSVLIVSFSVPLLHIFKLDPAVFDIGLRFLRIAGAALVIQGVLTVVTAIIQSHGYTRHTMMVTIGMNVLNLLGNYLVIYGPLGFPKLGVTGVAMSTAFAQSIGLAINLVILRKVAGVELTWARLTRWTKEHVDKVLRVGLPSSVNNCSYSASQFVTTALIATLGTAALTTRIYTMNLVFVVMILAISIGRGGQIIIGHMIGAGEREEAYRTVYRNLRASMLITLAAAAIIALLRVPLLELFTHDASIIQMGATLLLLGLLLEPGRNFNIIIERSLAAAGDARFAMYAAVSVSWLFSVPMTYLLGIHLGYGLLGIWAAFIMDEWLRGLILLLRWRSKAWQRKALVQRQEEAAV